MPLEQSDLDHIERIIYKNSDDLAISIARSFERLEERIDAAESRIYTRLTDLEDKVGACEHNVLQDFDSLRSALS